MFRRRQGQRQQIRPRHTVVGVVRITLELNPAGHIHPQLIAARRARPGGVLPDPHVVGPAHLDHVVADERVVSRPAVVVACQNAVGGTAQVHVGVQIAVGRVDAHRYDIAGQSREAPVVRIAPGATGRRVDRPHTPPDQVAAALRVLGERQPGRCCKSVVARSLISGIAR